MNPNSGLITEGRASTKSSSLSSGVGSCSSHGNEFIFWKVVESAGRNLSVGGCMELSYYLKPVLIELVKAMVGIGLGVYVCRVLGG